MTQDFIGHLKTLCMIVLSLSGGMEFEWKHVAHRSALKKCLAFRYESSLRAGCRFKYSEESPGVDQYCKSGNFRV